MGEIEGYGFSLSRLYERVFFVKEFAYILLKVFGGLRRSSKFSIRSNFVMESLRNSNVAIVLKWHGIETYVLRYVLLFKQRKDMEKMLREYERNVFVFLLPTHDLSHTVSVELIYLFVYRLTYLLDVSEPCVDE